MTRKILFIDPLPIDSVIQVGGHKYAKLFKKNDYEVFSLSHFLNVIRLLKRRPEEKELLADWRKGVQISKDGIYFYTPLCLFPYVNFPMLDNLKFAHNCLRFSYPNVRKILAAAGFTNIDLLFINNIRLISILNLIKAKVIIFRISDRIEGFKNMPKTISILQKETIKRANLVFATSRNLQQEASAINKNTFYLPNGVDEAFIMNKDEKYPQPEEYKKINSPIVLYIGAISDWFDYDLYEYGLENLKDISFVMIGPVSGVNYNANLSRIQLYTKIYRNFHYLGSRINSELKKYLFYSNIGVIPFKINSLTNEINPVKLFEYAAFMLPTIAPYLSELQNYKEYILFYKDKKGYADLIYEYIDKKTYFSEKLIKFAYDNTWEKRFEFMLSNVKGV